MKSVSVFQRGAGSIVSGTSSHLYLKENKPICTSNPHQFFKVETHTLHVEKKWNKIRTYRDKPPLILLHLHMLNT